MPAVFLHWHEYFKPNRDNLFCYTQKTHHMKKIILFLAAPLLFAACNNEAKDSVEKADSTNTAKMDTSNNNPPTISTDEESTRFLVDAANGGMAEVDLSKLAREKASNPKVKDFAAMMVNDHTSANSEVKTLAAKRNVTLPSTPGDEKKRTYDDLNAKSGADFDKAYMKTMVDDHEATIRLFEKASNNVNDTEVKTFVDNTLPKLKVHLDSAKAVRKILK
jgi:putative membrane protein